MPLSLNSIVGGLFDEQHFQQQYAMAGVSKMEIIWEDGLAVAGIAAQYNPFKHHYIILTGDVCSHTNNISQCLSSESFNWGVDASYNISTPVGPISLKGCWSNLTHEFAVSFSAGYNF